MQKLNQPHLNFALKSNRVTLRWNGHQHQIVNYLHLPIYAAEQENHLGYIPPMEMGSLSGRMGINRELSLAIGSTLQGYTSRAV